MPQLYAPSVEEGPGVTVLSVASPLSGNISYTAKYYAIPLTYEQTKLDMVEDADLYRVQGRPYLTEGGLYLDFAGAAGVVGEFPSDVEKLLTAQDKVTANAVKLLAAATREGGFDPAKIEENVKTIVSKQGKAVTPAQYGWLHFAIGAAYQSTIPADQLASNNIAAELKVNASKAIDAYCTAGISTHGAQMEIPVEAMKRAQLLLWSMPGVQAEVKAFGQPTPSKFKKASQNFQDAVTLAYMLINVYGVEADANSSIAKAAKLFQNTKVKKK